MSWPIEPDLATPVSFKRGAVWVGDLQSLMRVVRGYPLASGKTDMLMDTPMKIYGNRTIRQVIDASEARSMFGELARCMQNPDANKTILQKLTVDINNKAKFLTDEAVRVNEVPEIVNFREVANELRGWARIEAIKPMDHPLKSLGGATLRSLNIAPRAVEIAFTQIGHRVASTPFVLASAVCSQANFVGRERLVALAARGVKASGREALPPAAPHARREARQAETPAQTKGIRTELYEAILEARKQAPGGKTARIMQAKFPSLGGKSLNDIYPEGSEGRLDIAGRITAAAAKGSTIRLQALLEDVATEAVAAEIKQKMEKARSMPGRGKTTSVMHTPIQAIGGVLTLNNMLMPENKKQIDLAVMKYVNHHSTPEDSRYRDPILGAIKQAIKEEAVNGLTPRQVPPIGPVRDVAREPLRQLPPPLIGARDVTSKGRWT